MQKWFVPEVSNDPIINQSVLEALWNEFHTIYSEPNRLYHNSDLLYQLLSELTEVSHLLQNLKIVFY